MKKLLSKIALILVLCLSVSAFSPAGVYAKTTKITSGDKKTDQKAKKIIKTVITKEMSTEQKVKAIHDYIVLNCEYDYSNYLQGTIPRDSYSAKGALVKHKSVCQGYAEAFKLLMDMLNIPCKVVSGTANNGSGNGYQGHAWNVVKIDGKWYNIDVTWDDPIGNEKDSVNYGYFLINDSKLSKDHKWRSSKYPKCLTDNSEKFIKMIGEVSDSIEDAASRAYEAYTKGNGSKVVLILNKKLYDDEFISKLLDCINNKYDVFIGSIRYSEPTEYGDYVILKFLEIG